MADEYLERIPVILEKISSEIRLAEVHLANKLDETEFLKEIAAIKADYNAKFNNLLIKVAGISGIISGAAGYFF